MRQHNSKLYLSVPLRLPWWAYYRQQFPSVANLVARLSMPGTSSMKTQFSSLVNKTKLTIPRPRPNVSDQDQDQDQNVLVSDRSCHKTEVSDHITAVQSTTINSILASSLPQFALSKKYQQICTNSLNSLCGGWGAWTTTSPEARAILTQHLCYLIKNQSVDLFHPIKH
jgi:hypothetical protein